MFTGALQQHNIKQRENLHLYMARKLFKNYGNKDE